MRTYTCQCGNTLYFDNIRCLHCGAELGFDPEQLALISLQENEAGLLYSPIQHNKLYRKCENYRSAHVCNWLVAHDDAEPFCRACQLNSVIPDLSSAENQQRWLKLEKAKRRLLYTLISLQLPLTGFKSDPEHGLGFRFMEDIKELDPFSDEIVTYEKIMIGHDAGIITINIIEADDSVREQIRENMNESYRTILGHFRHESGHYYWNRLIARSSWLEPFRQLFGDERNDYKQSLEHYYLNGPTAGWMYQYISAYASAHPWEDWAETWAHYLHCIDILETASHHRVGIEGDTFVLRDENTLSWLQQHDFNVLMQRLSRLMQTLNELNRSLGLPDPYPFELSARVIEKLEFIHQLVIQGQHY